jgi:PIN domain nuclease of toxin-antitoxin system
VRLLLDTHVLIWTVNEPARMPRNIELLIKSAANQVFISAATPWEISIKLHIGKLAFDQQFLADFDARIRALAFTPLPISSAHAVAAGELPGRHKDPFDRMIVAQAGIEQLAVVTRDAAIAGLGAQVVW